MPTFTTSAAASCGVSMWLKTPTMEMPGVLGRLLFHAVHALPEVGGVLVPGQDPHLALAAHERGQLGHHLAAGVHVVHPVEGEALRVGGVAVEGHDGDVARDRVVDGARHLAGVRAGEEDGGGALVDRLGDALRLDLAVLLGGREPGDLDADLVLLRQLAGGRLGPRPGGEEDRVGRALGDERDLAAGGPAGVPAGFEQAATARGRRSEGELHLLHGRSFKGAHHARAARASRRAVMRPDHWSSTTATMVAQPMMIHS